MSDLSGQNIKGYELVERIGSGGFGAVYRSRQSTLGRDVALKVILPGFANHPDFIRRFELEAQLVARLEHLHIVPLYDFWRDPSGAYLVMRWMRGGSLRDAINENPFDLETAATILDQIASGLALAHREKVIHRDIKPSNILLDEDGNAYISDFGIATGVDVPTSLSEEDLLLGSPGYMSPEQVRKEPISSQSDIYCLGITLFEMLTGEYPFPNLTPVERLFEHINTPLPEVQSLDPAISNSVNEVIQIATAKNPQWRFRDVLEMSATFRTAARLDSEGEKEDLVDSLTKRELEIWKLIADGRSNKEISQTLFVEVSTVKWHVTQLYRKIGVRTRVQAIKRARETAFIYPMLPNEEQDVEAISTSAILLPELSNPYKGLLSFESADHSNFFGRESLIERLLSRLETDTLPRFIAVVGPSGSGKSSLVKAGLIPAIWNGELPGSQSWFTVEMVPGSRPLDELEVALTKIAANQAGNLREHLARDEHGLSRIASLTLPNDDSKLVLVVDQFEELFTLVREDNDRKQFIDLLCGSANDASSRVIVIITLRADFYDRPLQDPQFGELMRKCIEPVLPLSVEELEQAIVSPASKLGVHYEPGLVARIIDDANYQPAALPLLQYALTELFEKNENRLLTHQAYDAIGGTVGAIAKRAEDLYQELDQNGMDAARNLLLRLVTIDEAIPSERSSNLSTGNRVLLSEIMAITEDDDVMDQVLEAYSAYRLLALDYDPVTRKPTIELAHDAILREWDRLAAWVDEYKNDLIQHRRLMAFAQEWQDAEMDAGYLLREVRLDQFSAWEAETSFQLSPTVKWYLDKSLEARKLREEEEENRQKRELETIRKLAETEKQRADEQEQAATGMRRLTYGLATALVVAVILAISSFVAFRQSDLQRRLAESRQLAAASINQLETDPTLSVLLALQSVDRSSDVGGLSVPREAIEALHRAVGTSRVRYIYKSGDQKIVSAVFIPSELEVIFTYDDGTARLTNLDNEEIISFEGHENTITQVVFHPNGSQVATTSRDQTAKLWNLETGQEIITIQDSVQLFNCAFHPDGDLLATVGNDINAKIWDLETGNLQTTLFGHSDFVNDIEYSPDGETVVTSSVDGTIKIWDVEGGYELFTLDDHAQWVPSIDFSPDGLSFASASTDGVIIIWNAVTWEIQHVIHGHSEAVLGVEFSPDGSFIASAGEGQVVKLWDVDTGQEVITLPGDGVTVSEGSFSANGRYLVTPTRDGTVFVWDLYPGSDLQTITLLDGPGQVVFSHDGSKIVSPQGENGMLTIYDAISGEALLTMQNDDQANSLDVDMSSDDSLIATAGIDGTADVWDAETGELVISLPQRDGRINQVSFSPNGGQLGLVSENFSATLWDVNTGELIQEFGIDSGAKSLAFSSDDSLLAVGSEAGLLTIFDLHSSDEQLMLHGHTGSVDALSFGLSLNLLASGGNDGRVIVWDVETGQLLQTLSTYSAPVTDVSFTPDGSILAAVGTEGVIRIWDAANWEEILTLTTDSFTEGPIYGLAFSPDSKHLAVAGKNAIRIFTLDNEELIDIAQQRLTREFTFDECSMYLQGNDCFEYQNEESPANHLAANENIPKVCQITDVGGLQDNAINQNVYQGVMTGVSRFDWQYRIIETLGFGNFTKYVEDALASDCDLIVTIYMDMGGVAQSFAETNPEVQFLMLDYFSQTLPENAWAQIYAADQAAFLAGYAAASITETGVIGTFGGVNYPSVASFMIGFEQGVYYYNQKNGTEIKVIGWDSTQNDGLFIGDFCCFEEGYQFAEQLIAEGADIIMPVAGPFPGFGALEAARNYESILVVGVDIDWANALPQYADVILTSVEKRYNVSVLSTIAAIEQGEFEGNLHVGTLASGDVGISPFHHFEDLIPATVKAELAEIAAGIMSGDLQTTP